MKKILLLFIGIAILDLSSSAQNIGVGTNTPNANAMLDIRSGTKGILIPRMDSVARKLIPNITGMMVYDTTTFSLWQNTGSGWVNYYVMPKGNNGDILYWNNTQWTALPKGSTGQVLTMNASGFPSWQAVPSPVYSLAVTPVGAAINPGQTQQFTATATYADASTADISSSVAWSSSLNTIATVNSAGLAKAVNTGAATISATLGVFTANAALTVNSVPRLQINNASGTEGNSGTTNITFNVTLSATFAQAITVDYTTLDGTATAADNDYIPVSGSLTFNPGVQTQTVTVQVRGDLLNEADESFVVKLSNAVNATIQTSQGTGTIINDDAVPLLSINNVSANEGNTGSTNFTFVVSLSAISGRTVTVNYSTADATANAFDYTAASGTLTFAPGDTNKQIVIQVTGDTIPESNETFKVALSGAVNATITGSTGTGTIVNDD